MQSISIEDIIAALPEVHTDRNYWFVRTQGGQYYDDFYDNGFIAIGYDKIRPSEIKKVPENEYSRYLEELAQKVLSKYKGEFRSRHAASQLIKFTYDIKRGDIVLIPTYSSNSISFGEVVSTETYTKTIILEDIRTCPFLKRKKVRWLKQISRNSLDPNLYKLMFSQHAVTNGNIYAEYIDKVLNSFFIKDGIAHLVLDIQTKDKIRARDLFEMGLDILSLSDDFCKEENLSLTSEDVNVKINVQSPGIIELSGTTIGFIILIGLVCLALAGGNMNFTFPGIKTKFSTPGILKALSAFLKDRQKRKILEKYMTSLQVQKPVELEKIIRKLLEE